MTTNKYRIEYRDKTVFRYAKMQLKRSISSPISTVGITG